MSFASDKLYKGYLVRNMPTIVTKVKVREIVPHLPCLTDHDRETIEAKRETSGNFNAMMLLLDCLKRRENWAEQFINALEACDHPTLAAEIRAEYNALKGTNNSNPSSPSAAVTRAHVHAAPSASPSVLERGGNGQVAVAPPADVSVPAEPAAEASPALEIPVQPQAPPSLATAAAAGVPEIVSPPKAVAEAPQAAPAPSTPPPSPEIVRAPPTETPPPQGRVNSHQEPVEDSELDVQGISGDNGAVLDQVSAGNSQVSLDSADAPGAPGPVEQCETDTPACPDPQQTATTPELRPPRTPSPAQIDSDATDGSSFLVTPERPPVQDTTPPVDIRPAAVQQPEETSDISDTPTTQVVKTETAALAAPPPAAAAAAGTDPSLLDDVCLSKPGELVSVYPQNNSSSTVRPDSPVQPYSGNSDRLEISKAVTSAHAPACSAATVESAVTAPPCQENGVALCLNEPEENHYESPKESFEVHVSVGHISEQPSILDMDGQSLTPQVPTVNGEAAKEITSAPPFSTTAADTVSSVNPPASENHHPPSEPAPADISPEPKPRQDSDEKTCPHKLPANTKYILTAAGVGACALLMAWKFKN